MKLTDRPAMPTPWFSWLVRRLRLPSAEPHSHHDPRAIAQGPALSELKLKAMECAANGMFIADRKGRIRWINAAFTRLSGYGVEEATGKSASLLKSGRQSAAFYRALWRTILSGCSWRGRLVNRKKNGELYDIEQTISPIRSDGTKVTHFLAVHEDISEQLRNERRLVQEAIFDPDTELPNRSLLRRRLVDAIARAKRRGRFMAVLLVEVRPIPSTGDDLNRQESLAHASSRLLEVLRQTNLLARYGWRELAIVAEDLEAPDEAAGVADRMLRCLAEPPASAPGTGRRRVRIGIAVYPGDADTPEVLLQHAATALDAAKEYVKRAFR